jgi:SNF2 family DNA or RNA helicase
MENRLEELASVVEWVDDHALEPKWRLVPVHALRADGERSAVGVRGLDTLRARLAPCTVRRVRSEVIKQLPRRTDTQVPIELTAAQRELHAELDVPIASLLGRTERRSLTQEEFLRLMRLLLRQRQICNGLALAEFEEVWPGVAARRPTERVLASLDSPKLVELRALVESLVVDQGRKVVVFSQWRRQLELAAWAVSDVLAAAGLRALFFTGGEDARRRERNVVDFHDDPAARVLLATDAGGAGLNLQRAASACVLFELPWNPAVLEQRVGRIHRMGQKEPVQVYALVSEGGIEERIASLVADKQALFRGLFDGGSDEVLFDRSTSFVAGLRSMVGAAPEVPEAEEDPDEPAAAEPAAREPAHLGAGGVAAVFAGLRVDRTDGGGVRIEAPPESADALVAMLEGLLGALRRE